MAKIHPQAHLSSSISSSFPPPSSARRRVLTIWMKSLVMSGNGCTVYDSDGQVVYRVDNYACRCSDKVYLMDRSGNTLTRILQKKLSLIQQWEGYQCDGSTVEEKEPWFRVRKAFQILKRGQPYEATVTVRAGSNSLTRYKILGSACKAEYQIQDMAGGLVAEVKRKLTASGVALGDDVLTLVLEPDIDQLLIMGLVIVCGLINRSL